MPSVAVDPSDSKPIVIFYEGSGGRARVMKWSGGTSWTDLGYVSPSEAHEPRIIIDPSDNKPVVVYSEFVGGSYNFVQVLKWSDGTNWTDMGYPSPVGGLHPAIAIDLSDNKPIVAFTAGSHDYVQVVKWSSGTTWTDMGTPRPSEGDSPALAICPLDNKPVVALFQGGAYVYKWASGTAWTDLGCAILPGGSPDIALRADGTPVVVCTHQGWSGQVQVKHWAGSKQWSSMGYPSTGEAAHTSIAIDPSNNATFVLFTDGEYGWRAKVMRYDP
jgi:hypothetical protein